MTESEQPEQLTDESLRGVHDANFELFVTSNPETLISTREGVTVVSNPWGDATCELTVGPEDAELTSILNAIRLPPRFSAVWHLESRDLEFTYAPLPSDAPEASRAFTFTFRGTTYACEFAPASRAVELLANAVGRRVGSRRPGPDTSHRILVGLRNFWRFKATNPETNLVPTSFWIRNVALSEESLVEFSRHLNFYMRYFDRATPVISIFNDLALADEAAKRVRYPHGAFPSTLVGRPLDPYLLALWESAEYNADSFREFVHNYQVLEYAAFYFLREETFQVVKRIVAASDVLVRIDEAARQILDTVVEDRTSDDTKITNVVQKAVDPAALWREIEPHAAFFSRPTVFEGGFTIPALLKAGWGFDDFKAAWIPKVPDSLRKLRNALVHARETRQSCCIAPGRVNEMRLRHWVSLMSALSAQVIIFGDQQGA